MGNTATSEADEFAQFDGIETLGYRVLGVQPGSPASKAGLVSFFDFIVGANEQMLLGSGEGLAEGEEYDDIDFPALLHENKGKAVELLVWNIKAQEKRLVELIPSDEWDGAGLLGVTMKMDDYGGADERLIRVLEVEAESPAAVAGLVKDKDFLLGTTSVNFSSSADLAVVLEESINHVIELYVYNADTDMVRVVGLVPSVTWGGRGLLGAEVGTGYLHRLPNTCRDTIGKCVERKVRLSSAVPDEDGNGSQTETLELEPHLEMEVERDEDADDSIPLDSTKQPHELGNAPPAPKPHVAAAATTTQSQTATSETVIDKSPSSVEANNFFSGQPPAPVLDIPQPPKMTY
eukprot:Nitzschia sp. Nitz4//scaffold277_size25017//13476//14724//NITZ4_008347-RA/size25017-processed-gene-0.7-mRNA-1//1//CDS//3329545344//4647//frame0